MGKTGKNIKKRKLAALPTPSATSASDTEFFGGLLSPSELATATRVLNVLANNEELITGGKAALKALRGASFDFQRVSAELAGTGTTLTSRISAALSQGRWTDSLVLLSELRLRNLTPKLGALQRWVRDCDAASRSDGSFGNAQVLAVLEAILRTTTQSTSDTVLEPVARKEDWVLRAGSGDDLFAEVTEGKLPKPEEKATIAAKFRLLSNTPGPLRLPPNHHPALLYASSPSTIPLAATPALVVTRHDVPNVPGAFMLDSIFSAEECRQIVGTAEAVGFAPDRPVGEGSGSILAHNLYWLADEALMSTLWDRISSLLPQEIAGGKVTGLNSRFRVYRYVPGAIYRPHIDGQWPKSGIDSTTGEYLYDSSPATSPEWSRLTFLLYLNDGFSGGQTTFFLPSPSQPQLDAYPVRPIAGCALVFPHGDAAGSLLHEGSPVDEGGCKYVIRTEVLYQSVRRGKVETDLLNGGL